MRAAAARSRLAALVAAVLVGLLGQAPAIVDDAHSFAMEAALPFVEKGFKVRSDYWNGELKPGKRKAVKHQLFKGNEYCFWLGADADGVAFKIGVYDMEGNPVKAEVVKGNHATSLRVLPPSTGSYVVVFSLEAAEGEKLADEPISWALAYGYR